MWQFFIPFLNANTAGLITHLFLIRTERVLISIRTMQNYIFVLKFVQRYQIFNGAIFKCSTVFLLV